MYIKKCKWCEKEIEVEKQCLFALHVANCDCNPNKIKRFQNYKNTYTGKKITSRIKLEQNCPKCGKLFEIEITESVFKRNKYKKYCSLKCSNSKTWSDEHKKKLSETCKNSEKVKSANSIQTIGRRNRKSKKGKEENKYVEFVCEYCGEKGVDNRYNKNRKFHKECWLKISGGIRKGSSRGKNGLYKGYWCDSSYELAYVIYNLEHNNKIERNKIGYEYIYNDKKHLYYPDFRVNSKLVEIKNYRSELTDIKLKSVNEDIEIFYKDTIKPYINYVTNKYGKDFIKLYVTVQ